MNHIENIEIKNFKSIKHAEIKDCRRVNVFIGYPNVGKSNILEAIGLYSTLQLADDHYDFNEICRVKHFAELFFNQNSKENNEIIINKKISLELTLDTSNYLKIRVNIIVDYVGNPVSDNIFTATANNNNYNFQFSESPKEGSYKNVVERIKKYDFKNDSPIKAQRPYSLAIPKGQNLLNVLRSFSTLRKDIVEILRSYRLKLVIDNIDESIKFQKELNDETAVSIPYHQVADTLRRLIFYKAAILSNSNSILLFEEPEAHMFPPYISKLTSDIVNDENNNQFFLATHSPFVMNDLISNVEKEELSIYIVSYENETGETLIHRMSDEDVNEAYQFGYDFFMNIDNFIPQKQHD